MEASNFKDQTSSFKKCKLQNASFKMQASKLKLQNSSFKTQASRNASCKLQGRT